MKENKEVNYNNLIVFCFSLVAIIYFANAAYSYFYKIEGQVILNIGLGIMFFILGFALKMPTKKE